MERGADSGVGRKSVVRFASGGDLASQHLRLRERHRIEFGPEAPSELSVAAESMVPITRSGRRPHHLSDGTLVDRVEVDHSLSRGEGPPVIANLPIGHRQVGEAPNDEEPVTLPSYQGPVIAKPPPASHPGGRSALGQAARDR